jgi:hypothetical protein
MPDRLDMNRNHERIQYKCFVKSRDPKRVVKISNLKNFVANSFPSGSPIREVIMNENNELGCDLFLARLPIWLQLIKLETGRKF